MSAQKRRRKTSERRNAWRCGNPLCRRWLTTPEDIRTAKWTGECVSCQADSALRNLPAELVASAHEQHRIPSLRLDGNQ